MMQCDGLSDWTRCSDCRHICTPDCPIEGQDVVLNLSRRLKMLDSEGADVLFPTIKTINKDN